MPREPIKAAIIRLVQSHFVERTRLPMIDPPSYDIISPTGEPSMRIQVAGRQFRILVKEDHPTRDGTNGSG